MTITPTGVSPLEQINFTSRPTAGTYTLLTFTSGPSGGIAVGDELFLSTSWQMSTVSGTAIVSVPGWTLLKACGSTSISAGSTRNYVGAIWHRVADGTSQDLPTVQVAFPAGGGGTDCAGRMWGYSTTNPLTVDSSGTLGPTTPSYPSAGTTPATTTPVPAKSLVIASAYSLLVSPTAVPTLSTANGFSTVTSFAPTAAMPQRVTDDQFSAAGTISLPRFGNLVQGSSSFEHHALWVALVEGTSRRRPGLGAFSGVPCGVIGTLGAH